jgi:RNase P/RNase MRP subunit p30
MSFFESNIRNKNAAISCLIDHGFEYVILNHVFDVSALKKLFPIGNKLKEMQTETIAFSNIFHTIGQPLKTVSDNILKNRMNSPGIIEYHAHSTSFLHSKCIFQRLTIAVKDMNEAKELNNLIQKLTNVQVQFGIDIIAVSSKSTDEKVFTFLCANADVDVISIIPSECPLSGMLSCMRRDIVKTAIQRDVSIELCLPFPSLSANIVGEENFVRDFIAVGREFAATTSKSHATHAILTSAALRKEDVRNSIELQSIGAVLGMTPEAAHASISQNVKSIILHGFSRTRTFMGQISVSPISDNSSSKSL